MTLVILGLTQGQVMVHLTRTLSAAESAFMSAGTPTARAARIAINLMRQGRTRGVDLIVGGQLVLTGLAGLVQGRERRVWRVIDQALDIARDAIVADNPEALAEAMQNAQYVAQEMTKALPTITDLKGDASSRS